jgi:hypothetical protein
VSNAFLAFTWKSGGTPPHSITWPAFPTPYSRLRLGVRRCSAAFGSRSRRPTRRCRVPIHQLFNPVSHAKQIPSPFFSRNWQARCLCHDRSPIRQICTAICRNHRILRGFFQAYCASHSWEADYRLWKFGQLRVMSMPFSVVLSPIRVISVIRGQNFGCGCAASAASAVNSLLPRAQLPAEPDLGKTPIAQDCFR